MWEDPIVKEVRQVREKHAAEFGHDLQRIADDVKQREKLSSRELVLAPPPRLEPVTSQS